MRVIFNAELKHVAEDLDHIAQNVHWAMINAGKALLEADLDTAQAVIDADAEIDALEKSIFDQCVELLAKQNPVATDLRVVVSTIRLASTFERMGDLARHIAETARRAYPEHALANVECTELFTKMQDFDEDASSDLIAILGSRDVRRAEQIILNDDKLDKLHEAIFSIANDESWNGSNQQLIDVVLLGRYYERFGDHAVSVARQLVYIVSGFDPTKEPSLKQLDSEDREDAA